MAIMCWKDILNTLPLILQKLAAVPSQNMHHEKMHKQPLEHTETVSNTIMTSRTS